MLAAMRKDLVYAGRMLRRQRGLSTVIVVTLALAIGANTAIFSLMDALLLQALPVRDPQTLMLMQWSTLQRPEIHSSSSYGDCRSYLRGKGEQRGCSFSVPFYNALREQTRSLEAVTASAGGNTYVLTEQGQARNARAMAVAGNYFSVLGVRPATGRMLTSADDVAGAPIAMVISYAYWQSAFAGSRGVVGATVALNHVPATIVGVAEPRFTALTPGRVFDGWVPLAAQPKITPYWNEEQRDRPSSIYLTLFGRVRPGFTAGQAQAEVSGIFRNQMLAGPQPLSKPQDDPRVTMLPAQTGLVGVRGQFTQPLTVLMWTVGAILLIACANVAGLLLGRASARQKEFALRRALGAGGGRILRQLLTESLLLAGIGGILGLGLAWVAARALMDFLSAGTERGALGMHVALDGRVLLFTLGATLATGLLFGLAPGLRGARTDLNRSLKDSMGSTAASGGRRFRWAHLGNALVVAQVGLCMVVLAGAGLLVRTLENLRAVPAGFTTSNVLMFGLQPQEAGYNGARRVQIYQTLLERIAALPGVLGASYSSSPLLSGDLSRTSYKITPGGKDVDSDVMPVGLNFFATMRIPLLEGREFVPTDFMPETEQTASAKPAAKAPPGPPVAVVVNEMFARQYLGPGVPIGRIFGQGDNGSSGGYVVVGVSANAKYQSLREATQPTVYTPSAEGSGNFEVRTAGDAMAMLAAVRNAIRNVDPGMPLSQPTTQAENIDQLLFNERLTAGLASCLGGLALLLACIGLYGLLAQEVRRRTREIGIRMALGAQRAQVLRMVLALGAGLGVLGLGVGVAGAWGLTRYLGSMLFGVTAMDATTLGLVGALLLAVALAACLVPARRATKVDPLEALRYE